MGSTADAAGGHLSRDDVARFNAFGFLALRGLLSRQEALALRAECEALTRAENPDWDGATTAGVGHLCEKGERHAALLDDDRLYDIPHKILGHDFMYEGSACTWYQGDTPWHGGSGVVTWRVPHIKVSLYLDELGLDDGCLRVLPGAHRNYLRMIDERWSDAPDYFIPVRNRNTRSDFRPWGLPPDQVPHIPLPTRPGDVLVFTEDLPHAAFGSAGLRLQVALAFLANPRTPEQIAYLRSRAAWGGELSAPRALLESDSPRRRRMAQPLADLGLGVH